MIKTAIISECGLYRYALTRTWDPSLPTMIFVMLNPSTADATEDDNTIRRCIGFAKREGYGTIIVVNLFAYRATDPSELLAVDDPVGPENDAFVSSIIQRQAGRVVCGWGTTKIARTRLDWFRRVIEDTCGRVECLGANKDGSPKHPLYLPKNSPLKTWE